MITLSSNLKEGTHRCRLVSVALTDSFSNFSSVRAEKDRDYTDATPQIGMVFGGNGGTHVHRAALCGYRSFEDLTAEEIKALEKGGNKVVASAHMSKNGNHYALFIPFTGKDPKTKKDTYGPAVRLVDDSKKETAENILAGILKSFGVQPHEIEVENEEEQAQVIVEVLQQKIVDKTPIEIVLRSKSFTKDDGSSISSCDLMFTRKPKAVVEIPETEAVEEEL